MRFSFLTKGYTNIHKEANIGLRHLALLSMSRIFHTSLKFSYDLFNKVQISEVGNGRVREVTLLASGLCSKVTDET